MARGDGNGKKEQVERMFDDIAPTYDALNHLLSLGVDRSWRRKVVRMVSDFLRNRNPSPQLVLDVATGTGDLAIALAKKMPTAKITGVDISESMLAVGREKADGMERVALQRGDAEALGFEEGSFDCVTVAFGVRNFGDIPRGLHEMWRVLRGGGSCFILEFSEPTVPVFGWIYRLYFHRVLPCVGRLVSKDAAAYSYLPRSVDGFPPPARFAEMVRQAGFSSVRIKRLSLGIAYIYEAEK